MGQHPFVVLSASAGLHLATLLACLPPFSALQTSSLLLLLMQRPYRRNGRLRPCPFYQACLWASPWTNTSWQGLGQGQQARPFHPQAQAQAPVPPLQQLLLSLCPTGSSPSSSPPSQQAPRSEERRQWEAASAGWGDRAAQA